MARPSRFGWPSLAAFFLLFLSLLNIATAVPLPDDHEKKTLVARGKTQISQSRYEAYLQQYFPDTDHYAFYSGKSKEQVTAFKEKNPAYKDYDDLFTANDDDHPWYKAFNDDVDEDDAEASSKAMAAKASGDVVVFGAIEYKTEGAESYFALYENERLRDGIKDGRVKSLNHMIRGATNPSEVMAKEDADANFIWQNGFKEGDKNFGKPDTKDVVDDVTDTVDDVTDTIDDWTR